MGLFGDDFEQTVKRFEGYAPRASWDYKQHSNGWGTRARYPGEAIDQAEAQRRLDEELSKAHGAVRSFAPNLDAGTTKALTDLTFNAGTKWQTSGLGAAIKAGDLDKARNLYQQYVKAGGETLPGLVERRKVGANWIGAGGTPSTDGQPGMRQPYPWMGLEWPQGQDIDPNMLYGTVRPRAGAQGFFDAAMPTETAPERQEPPMPPPQGPRGPMVAGNVSRETSSEQSPNFIQRLSQDPLFMGGLMMALEGASGGNGVTGFTKGAGTAAGIKDVYLRHLEAKAKHAMNERQMAALDDHRQRGYEAQQQKIDNWYEVKNRQAEIAAERARNQREHAEAVEALRLKEQGLRERLYPGGEPDVGLDPSGGFYLKKPEARVEQAGYTPGIAAGANGRKDLPVDRVGSEGGFVPTSQQGVYGTTVDPGKPFHPGAKAIARKEAEDIIETTDMARLDPKNNARHNMIVQKLGDAYGGGKLQTGKRWTLNDKHQLVQEDIPGATKLTAGERSSSAIAKMGIEALDYAQPILVGETDGTGKRKEGGAGPTSGMISRFLASPTSYNGKEIIGGFGETGRAFKAMEGAVQDLNFYLSGKSVSNSERETFKRIYMPQSTDSDDTLAWKNDRLRRYFKIVGEVRDGTQDNSRLIRDTTLEFIREGNKGAPKAENTKDSKEALRADQGAMQEAREALSRGVPRDKIIERLRANGIDPKGL